MLCNAASILSDGKPSLQSQEISEHYLTHRNVEGAMSDYLVNGFFASVEFQK